MNKKEIREKILALHTEAEDIRKEYNGKPGEMPGDKMERWEKCLAEADTLQKQYELLEKHEANEAWAKKVDDIIVIDQREADKKGRAPLTKIFGELASAATLNGALAAEYMKEYLADAEAKGWLKKGASLGSFAGGGAFVLPLELASEIIRTAQDEVFVRRYAPATTLLNAESLGYITVDDIDDFDWVSELNVGPEDTNDPFGRRELTPHAASKLIKVSKKLTRLSPRPEQEIMSLVDYKRAGTEEKAFLTGNGNNRPLGVFTESDQGISTDRNRATAAANVVTGDDFINCVADAKGNYRNGMRWLIHRNLEGRVRKLKDSENNYIWSPFGGVGQTLAGGMPSTIAGFPYDLSEFMTDPGLTGNITTGTFAALLANWRRGYRIADALAMTVQPLYELYAGSNQQGYIFRFETDGMPVDENAFVRMKVA